MSRQSKSQWNFGELFPTEQIRRVLSVSELTEQIKRLLEKEVGQIWVSGEVTNCRQQASGHVYFTLKDSGSQLSCVLFRDVARRFANRLEDGRSVILHGDVTVYELRGQYQLIVDDVELRGVGALQVAFDQLKQKLQAEGLFAPERKRPMPQFPRRIGLVTSPTGAAIRDVLHVIERRNPSLEIILAPCRVQGAGAAEEIARAIRLLNEFSEGRVPRVPHFKTEHLENSGTHVTRPSGRLDLILITRGGGSLEDLWAFNEEVVARAIFESALPVVSAVGHEIDFSISDFVADLRAATPSAAAGIITEGVFSSCQFVGSALERLRRLSRQQLEGKEQDIETIRHRLQRLHPRRRFDELLQRLDDLQNSSGRCARRGVRERIAISKNLTERLWRVRPARAITQQREGLVQEKNRLLEHLRHRISELKSNVTTLSARLRLLGPEQVLARGYSITMNASGAVLRNAAHVKRGERLRTRLKTGEIQSVVEQANPDQGATKPR